MWRSEKAIDHWKVKFRSKCQILEWCSDVWDERGLWTKWNGWRHGSQKWQIAIEYANADLKLMNHHRPFLIYVYDTFMSIVIRLCYSWNDYARRLFDIWQHFCTVNYHFKHINGCEQLSSRTIGILVVHLVFGGCVSITVCHIFTFHRLFVA